MCRQLAVWGDQENFPWRSGCNMSRQISIRRKKEKKDSLNTRTCAPVCAAQPSSSPLTYKKKSVIKRKKRNWLYFYTPVWFGLVSLFNDLSTFVGYIMPKPFSYYTPVLSSSSVWFQITNNNNNNCKWLNCSIWPIDGTLTGTFYQGLSGSENNGNERAPHILQNSRTGASSPNAV